MKKGYYSLALLLKKFTEIDSINKDGYSYKMYEHNFYGDSCVVVVNHTAGTYCYTEETLQYTIENDSEFEWYKLRKKGE